MMIGDLWVSHGMVPELCQLTGRDRRTVERWLQKRQLPYTVSVLLDIIQNGNLGRIHDEWTGWSIDQHSGALVSPVDTRVLPGEILSIPYRLQLHVAYHSKIHSLEQQLSQPAKDETTYSQVFHL